MPQLQVVNTTRDKPEPTGVQEFFSKLGKSYQEDRDKVEIGNIIDQYKNNRNNANAWEDLQLNLEKSNISPSRRLEAQKNLMEQKKVIIAQDKALNQQFKEKQDEAVKQRGVEALRKSGASDEQVALYEASDQGGRTKVVEDVIQEQNRKKAPVGLVPEGVKDYDEGLTPKERVKRQDDRYRIQSPLVMKNSDALHSLENENLSIGLLQELNDSGKVGQGLQKLNINPKTGDLFIPQLGTAEEQLFVKTVNDFTVKAKDSFGARVTNFELDRFMQRLPTLANSPEGRRLIMRQMQVINELNQIEKKEVQNVFDQYGVRNIDYADAENIARERIKDQKEGLRKEYLTYEDLAKKEEVENLKNLKANVKEGYTIIRKADGTIKQTPTKNLSNVLEKGYTEL